MHIETKKLVRDVMTGNVRSIDRRSTMLDAIHTMKEFDISSMVVSRNDDSDEIGLITVADIAREIVTVDKAPERVHVFEIMSKPVVTLHADMTVRNAILLLAKLDLSRAVVIDESRNAIGMVTRRDLVLGIID